MRQTDSNGALSKRPLVKLRSVSLQVAPAKPTTKRKKSFSHDSDLKEPEGVVYVPQITFPGPPVMEGESMTGTERSVVRISCFKKAQT